MLRRVLPDSRRWQLLFAATSLVLAWMMVQSAWLSDDGLITFRTLESSAASMTFFAPIRFVSTASIGLYSHACTCFRAAAWTT